MLVAPMGVPHICTIVLGGYLPVRLVGDVAYSNHCGDSIVVKNRYEASKPFL